MAPPEDRPLSAIPSRRARALAFAAILAGGLCGALIASSFVRIQCAKDCTTAAGIAAVVGALFAAVGVAVVAVLVLRAMGEWRRVAAQPADEAGVGNGPAEGGDGAEG